MTKINLVIDYIKQQIETGKWEPGHRLPGECDLGKFLSVSRITVRSALEELKKTGIIEKKKGSGSYVTDTNPKKKYIMIILDEYYIHSASISISYTVEKLSEIIKNDGYEPYIYIENKNETFEEKLNINPNDIAGIICTFFIKQYRILKNRHIPIVNISNLLGKNTPSVIFDYESLFKNITKLLDKYNFKNILLIQYEHNIENMEIECLAHFGFTNYMQKHYNTQTVFAKYQNTANEIIDIFAQTVSNLSFMPQVIIFTDDTLYKAASAVFPNFENIISNTKIITQGNNRNFFNEKYPSCRISYNLDDAAKKTYSLLKKYINKEFTNSQIFIQPVIENEESLINEKWKMDNG